MAGRTRRLVAAGTVVAAAILAAAVARFSHNSTPVPPSARVTAPAAESLIDPGLPSPSASDEAGTRPSQSPDVADVLQPQRSMRRKPPQSNRPAPMVTAAPSRSDRAVPQEHPAPSQAQPPQAGPDLAPGPRVATIVPENPMNQPMTAPTGAEPVQSAPPSSAAEPRPPEAAQPTARAPEPPVVPPVPVDLPPPRHPLPYQMIVDPPGVVSAVRLKGVEARVRLRLLIRADGSVGRAEVATPSGRPELDEAALGAATAWRFLPARRGGVPIESLALIWVVFTSNP